MHVISISVLPLFSSSTCTPILYTRNFTITNFAKETFHRTFARCSLIDQIFKGGTNLIITTEANKKEENTARLKFKNGGAAVVDAIGVSSPQASFAVLC